MHIPCTEIYCCRHGNPQDYLVRRADRHSIPKVDNTNVDRSVATIHATLTGALRRREQVAEHYLQGILQAIPVSMHDTLCSCVQACCCCGGMHVWLDTVSQIYLQGGSRLRAATTR